MEFIKQSAVAEKYRGTVIFLNPWGIVLMNRHVEAWPNMAMARMYAQD